MTNDGLIKQVMNFAPYDVASNPEKETAELRAEISRLESENRRWVRRIKMLESKIEAAAAMLRSGCGDGDE
jgi:hypothetical protein